MARAGAHTLRAHAFGPSLQLALHVTKWSSGYALGDLVGLGDSLDRDWRVRVRRDLGAAASPTRAGVLLEEVLGVSGADLATTWVWVRDFADWAARLACLLRIDVRALGEVRRYLGFALGGEDCTRTAADLLGPLVTVLSMLRNAMPDPLAASERSRSPRGRRGAVPAGAQLAQERPLVPAWRADAIAQRLPGSEVASSITAHTCPTDSSGDERGEPEGRTHRLLPRRGCHARHWTKRADYKK